MRLTLLAFFLTAVSPIASSAPTEPAELTDLVRLYEEATRAAQEPIDIKFIEKLKELSAQFTRDEKLEEAAAVEKILREALADLEASRPKAEDPALTDAPPPGTIFLRGDRAVLEGSLRLNDDLIGNWFRTQSRAAWNVRDVPAGKYDIYLLYDAAADMGGTLEIADFSYKFDVAIEPTTKEVSLVEDRSKPSQNTGSGSRPPKLIPRIDRSFVFKRQRVGTMETKGGTGMKVTAKAASDAGILNLREIQLVPATATE